jgi:nucleoside-diphosphate-sugar epimerase
MSFLIVGKNSFISKSITGNVTRVSFQEIGSLNFKNYDVVLNCSIHPDYKEKKYDIDCDLDYFVAKKSQDNGCHFIMLSSRKVYGTSNNLISFDEDSEKNPDSYYGENKLITEEKIQKEIYDFSILRCSNIYGLERNRKSFFGFCIDQLIDKNEIRFELDEKTKRDFLPVEKLNEIIQKIASKKTKGVYNVSSNYGLEIGSVALSLIKGFGKGKFHSQGEIQDQFILNNEKIKKELNLDIKVDFQNHIQNIGDMLCKT